MPDVRVIAIDLARVGAAQELYDRMAAEGIGVDVVINNAGIFSFCDILATPAERIERIILLHDLTVTQLCRLFAADMYAAAYGGTSSTCRPTRYGCRSRGWRYTAPRKPTCVRFPWHSPRRCENGASASRRYARQAWRQTSTG